MVFRFADCILDCERRELARAGRPCRLEPQAFDLLVFLIENRERVVSREEVFQAIWRGRIVSESILDTRINAVRRAIGDNGAQQRLVRTLRRQGLRFVAPVSEESRQGRPTSAGGLRPSSSAQSIRLPEQAPGIDGPPVALTRPRVIFPVSGAPTILVLPFATIGADPRAQEFADGLTEDVVAAIASLGWCFVSAARRSSRGPDRSIATAAIARNAAARYLIGGSVRRAEGHLRTVVRLVDAATQHHLWAGRYDHAATDALSVQDEIVRAMVPIIGDHVYAAENACAKLTSPDSPGLWQHVVRALALVNTRDKRNVRAAGALLQRAIAEHEGAACAHGLASFVTTLGVHLGWHPQRTAVPAALVQAGRALALDPEDPWAHLAQGYATLWLSPEDSIPRFHSALALDPNLAFAHYLVALASARAGKPGASFAHADCGTRLSHRDLLSYGNAGVYNNVRATSSFVLGRHEDAIAFASAAIAESPKLAPAHRQLVVNQALAGRPEEAAAALRRLRQLTPAISLRWIEQDHQWARREDEQKYVEAFRLAGLTA